jgi:ribulose-phosphate 3-epimerase
MISNAESSVEWYLDAGADLVVVHAEACDHLHRVVQTIHGAGAQAGVSLNPATPPEVLRDIIGELDLVLLMSVNPGFGGQSFIPRTVEKVRRSLRSVPRRAPRRSSKSTAASTSRPRRSWPRREHACSSQVARCSAPRTRSLP